MAVQLTQFLLEIEAARLVILRSQQVFVVSHLAVVAAVEFKHVSEGLLTLDIHLVEFLNEGKCCLEVALETHHLFLVLEAHHRLLRSEVHVLQRLLVRDREVGHGRVEIIEVDARHLRHVIVLVPVLITLHWHACGEHGQSGHGRHGEELSRGHWHRASTG